MGYVTGERAGDAVLDLWAETINQCHLNDLNHVLMTFALRGKYQPFNAIEIYQAVIEMLKHSNLTIAFVDLNHLSIPDSQVACNMGVGQGIDVAFFDNQFDAKSWLKQQDKSLAIDVSKSPYISKHSA